MSTNLSRERAGRSVEASEVRHADLRPANVIAWSGRCRVIEPSSVEEAARAGYWAGLRDVIELDLWGESDCWFLHWAPAQDEREALTHDWATVEHDVRTALHQVYRLAYAQLTKEQGTLFDPETLEPSSE